ncbi:MAG: hypothetical protein IKU86_12890 [Thermoguttaceae bacterium]|nr:hypothetical protein [Thermoguttaceae bacterium]
MKRTLMMLVAALAMTVVASVQAADVKVNLQDRDANNQLVAAQNVKYSIADSEGKIVANGEQAEIALDLAEGVYEITVEQNLPNEQVHYGAQALSVPAEGAEFALEIAADGLKPAVAAKEVAPTIAKKSVRTSSNVCKCKYCKCSQSREYCRDNCNCPYCDCGKAAVPVAAASVGSCNTWGFLGLTGALVATAIALGVDDDVPPRPVSPFQGLRR